jgi:hypothetical protein
VAIGARAAGASWTRVKANAPWAARTEHTSVIDAAGGIYVLGGNSYPSSLRYNDVWRSADGGAPPHLVCARAHARACAAGASGTRWIVIA